jgi:hypothetical protein
MHAAAASESCSVTDQELAEEWDQLTQEWVLALVAEAAPYITGAEIACESDRSADEAHARLMGAAKHCICRAARSCCYESIMQRTYTDVRIL